MISHVILPDDLIIEVLSFLNVKSLMRFKSISKLWKTLISDPTFVELHHQHSPKNKHIALNSQNFRVHETIPLNHLLIENPSITIPKNPYNPLEEINECSRIIGSCNGLLCLRGYSYQNIWFRIWNPSTNTISKRLGYITCNKFTINGCTFGYDNSTQTYKVVVLSPTHQVKILNLRDNSWRTISSFPPYHHVILSSCLVNDGVYLSGTVNWFTIQSNLSYDYYEQCRNNITVDRFVIISLDLGTETYMQFSPPRSVDDDVPYVEPTIVVLMDCLCFSRSVKGTYFVIWKMTEFGVEQSWTQFLKISFQNLQVDDKFFYRGGFFQLCPLCLSENGHTLILKNSRINQLILYNMRDNRVHKIYHKEVAWMFAKNYGESLASIC